jgi:hypothetical protein
LNFEDKTAFLQPIQNQKSISIIDPLKVKRELEGIVSKVGSIIGNDLPVLMPLL